MFLESIYFLKVEEAAAALPKAVEASKAEVEEALVEEAVEAFKAEEAEALVEEAVEVFKAAVDLVEAVVVVAAATEVAEVISLKLKPKYRISQNHFVVN